METASLTVRFTAETHEFDKGKERVIGGLDTVKQKASTAFSNASQDIAKVGSNLANMGKNLLTLAVPANAFFGVAIHNATKFDEQMHNVASVMGFTKDETTALGNELLVMARSSKFSGTEFASSMYDIVSGVADVSAHMDIMSSSVLLAEANNADLVASNKALISTYNAFQRQGTKVNRIMDTMTGTIKIGVGTMDELASVFAKTAGLASPLGMTVEELGFLFGDMSTRGITFGQAGTQIEAVLTSLLTPTTAMSEAFKKMGMTQADVLKQIESDGLISVINSMTEAGIDLTKAFTNKEALLGVLSIAGIDASGLTDFVAGLDGITEATREIASESAQFKLDVLTSQFNDLMTTIGLALLPAFSDVVEGITPIVESFAEWASQNGETLTTIFKITAGIVALSGAIGIAKLVLAPIIGLIAGVFNILAVAIIGTTKAFAGLAIIAHGMVIGALRVVGLIAYGAVTAFWMLGNAINTIVVVAFTALATVLRTIFFGAVWLVNGALGVLTGIIGFLVANPLVALVAGVLAVTTAILSSGEGGLIGGLNRAKVAFEQLITLGIYAVLGALAELSNSPLFVAIRTVFETTFNTIKRIVEGVVGSIVGFLGGIRDAINEVLGLLSIAKTEYTELQNASRDRFGNWLDDRLPPPSPNRVAGGFVGANKPYVVGERGREVFVPSVNGTIIPNRKLQNNGGVVISGTINVYGVQDAESLLDRLNLIASRRGA